MKTLTQGIQTCKRLIGLISLLAVAVLTYGDNVTVSMDDFSIAPGERHTVSINVTNDVACGSAMGGIIDLPTGLMFVKDEEDEYLAKNAVRCDRNFAFEYATSEQNGDLSDNQIKFSIYSGNKQSLKGTEGAVLTFIVEASTELAEDSKIRLLNGQIRDDANSVTLNTSCEANVHNSSYIATVMRLSAADFSLTPSKEHNLVFSFEKNKDVTAFQADITLPEGMEFVSMDGDYVVFDDSRLSSRHTYYTNFVGERTLRIVLSASANKPIQLDEGEFFTVRVKAGEGLGALSAITVSGIEFAQATGSQIFQNDFSISVSNPDVAAKAEADEKIDEVKSSFEETKTAIASYDESVQAKVQANIEEITTKLTEIENTLADDVANGDVATNADTRNASIEDVKALIATLSQNAADNQAAYEANEKQHTADLAAIAEVQKALETAKTEIAEMAESVQNSVAEDITNADNAVAALTTAAEASYAAGTSVADAETLAAAIADVNAQIEALKKKAADNQAAYEANEAQHTADLAAIAEVQKALETAKTEIAEMAESVQNSVAEDITNADNAVAALTTAAEASYAAGTSVADAEKLAAAIADVNAQIEALKKKTADNQAAYEANEKQHTADLASIQDVQAKLDAVKDKISGYEESVRELVAEDIARIQKLIDEASAAAEKSYTEGTSVTDAEVLKAQIMAIEAQITALDTKAAFEQEKAYLRGDIDETGKVDINDLAIIRDLILGKSDAEEMTEKQQQAADLNADGKYSVVDLVMLNNVIVYGNPDGPATTNAKDATLAGMESGSLTMLVEAGRMDIALNSNMPYAAIQMDITMPEGISMDDVTFAGTSEKVVIGRNMLEDGVCRILMYTTDNSAILDRETSLLSIKLAGNGDGIVSIDNIMAATSRGEGRELAAVNGNFTIVTGINAVDTESMGEASVFDTNGIKRQTMRKGINIVRDAAGRVKKVLVK